MDVVDGGSHADGGVPSDPAVEAVDPAGDGVPRLVSVANWQRGQQLVLEGGEERLGRRVVQRGANPAHRLGHAEAAPRRP